MDEVNIVAEMQKKVPTCESIPHFIRGRAQFAFKVVLEELRDAYTARCDVRVRRAWKIFLFMRRLLLRHAAHEGEEGDQSAASNVTIFSGNAALSVWTMLSMSSHSFTFMS